MALRLAERAISAAVESTDAASFEDLPGKWQAAVVAADQNRPRLRVVTRD